MKDWEEYYKGNPQATLAEYANYCAFERLKKNEEKEKAESFYETLIGKYYRVNFDGCSFIVFHYNKRDENGCTKYLCYCYKDWVGGMRISRESRFVNLCWFINPYLEGQNTGICDCKEITKEQYEEIAKKCDDTLYGISCKMKTM